MLWLLFTYVGHCIKQLCSMPEYKSLRLNLGHAKSKKSTLINILHKSSMLFSSA
jgi:hypothetical protein